MSEPFRYGEPCLLVDGKGRHYLLALRDGGEFHFHGGKLDHAEIVGAVEGTALHSSAGQRLVPLRPRLADYILSMKRGPQVVYPKDIGPILVWADVAPGMTVLEAGTGSGALAMALARAVGPTGRVVSVERREDHARHGRKSVERYFGGVPGHLELRIGDVEEAVADVGPDRLILDVPEPWHVVGPAGEHLAPGGVFCAYVPTVPQVQQLRDALRSARRFIEIDTFEVLHREWSVEGRSVRPAHQMVGHTGFITVARRVMPLAEDSESEGGQGRVAGEGDRASQVDGRAGNAGEPD